MDLRGAPAGYECAAVQHHFHQADHAGVVNLDAGILCRSDGDRQRQSLEQGKVDMHVQALGLERGEAIGDGEQLFAHRSQVIEAFLQAEVGKVVGAGLIAQEGGELLVLLDEGSAIVSAEDVMAVFDLFEDRVQLALHPLCNAVSEDLGNLVGGQAPETYFTTAFKDLVDGEMAFEDEVAAVFDLADGIESPQVHGCPLPFGKLGSEQQRPVVEPFANHFGGEAVCGCLQRLRVGDGQKRVIVLAEAHLLAVQFLLDKAVTVQIVGGLKRKERSHAHDHWPQSLVADVEVVVGEAASLASQNTVVGIGGGEAGNRGAERLALLHTFENEIYAMPLGSFHAAQGGTHVVLLAHLRLSPFDGDGVVACIRLHPSLILVGPARQHFLADHRLAHNVLEEMDHLPRPGQTTQISVNHHPVKTVIYKQKQAVKQICKRLHRSSSCALVLTTRSSDRRPVVSKFQISLASINTWMGRLPAVITHWKLAAGDRPSAAELDIWSAALIFSAVNDKTNKDHWIQSWLMVLTYEMSGYHSTTADLAVAHWWVLLREQYPGGIKETMIAYLADGAPSNPFGEFIQDFDKVRNDKAIMIDSDSSAASLVGRVREDLTMNCGSKSQPGACVDYTVFSSQEFLASFIATVSNQVSKVEKATGIRDAKQQSLNAATTAMNDADKTVTDLNEKIVDLDKQNRAFQHQLEVESADKRDKVARGLDKIVVPGHFEPQCDRSIHHVCVKPGKPKWVPTTVTPTPEFTKVLKRIDDSTASIADVKQKTDQDKELLKSANPDQVKKQGAFKAMQTEFNLTQTDLTEANGLLHTAKGALEYAQAVGQNLSPCVPKVPSTPSGD